MAAAVAIAASPSLRLAIRPWTRVRAFYALAGMIVDGGNPGARTAVAGRAFGHFALTARVNASRRAPGRAAPHPSRRCRRGFKVPRSGPARS